MHMADALVSPAVSGTMTIVSAGAVGYSVKKIKENVLAEEKVPLMAVIAAFIFAAQMINFTIPGTGSSGHIGGGMLLATLLGGPPALIAISAVLIIQCLFFADGGLLALGCNIFNMGVVPCLIIFPLIKKIIGQQITMTKITICSIVGTIVALQIGSFMVVLETQVSAITELQFPLFILFMQPIHLVIGIVEGIITGAIVCFIYRARPEIIEGVFGLKKHLTKAPTIKSSIFQNKKILITFGVSAICIAGFISLMASANPDGLEWSIQGVTGKTELAVHGSVFDVFRGIQNKLAIMPDYELKGSGSGWSLAGILGAVGTLLITGLIAGIITIIKKKKVKEK